jgi:hypothetical protein
VLRPGGCSSGGLLRLSGPVSRAMIEQCCASDLGYLLLQINVICLLLALVGATAIVKHPTWFGGTPAITQKLAGR